MKALVQITTAALLACIVKAYFGYFGTAWPSCIGFAIGVGFLKSVLELIPDKKNVPPDSGNK